MPRGDTDYTATNWKVGDYGALVTMLGRGLSGMAPELATCLRRRGAVTARTDGDNATLLAPGPAMACPSSD